MNFSEVKQAAREGRASVHLHGFCNLPDGGQEHYDDPALVDGWAIYVRVETPGDSQQPFDLHELPDHQMLRRGTTTSGAMPCACGRASPGGRSRWLLQTEYRQLMQYYNIESIMAKCHNRAACMMLARNRGDYFTWADRTHHGTSD